MYYCWRFSRPAQLLFPSGAPRPIWNIRTPRMRVETIFVGLPGRRSLSLRVSPSRAPVLSCAHYFQSGIFYCVNGWCRRTKFCLPQNCRLNIRMAEEHLITCISMEKSHYLKRYACLSPSSLSFANPISCITCAGIRPRKNSSHVAT